MQTLTADLIPVPEQLSEIWNDNPHSIALSYGDRQLSYEELNRRADRFAGYLMQFGVELDGTVAICMERSFDWIVAALGIMRAGAAYVPLDSAWPDARLRFAVRDSGATALVARAAFLDRLQVDVIGIDPHRDAATIAVAPEAVCKSVQSESLAYVIYTSGSTGVPKGVEITHANLAHLVRWHREAFRVTGQDRVSHLAGLGFDAAAWEIWPNLCAGATVCLADEEVRSSPELIKEWMTREKVTIGFVPTVHAERMLAMDWPAATALRLLLTGGDAMRYAPAVQLPFDVVNNYGLTECTVVSISSVIKPGVQGAPPIGCPIARTSVYLLNEGGEQVPDGGIGEIYIAGSGVGRGYRNLPAFTEQSFLADPFAGMPEARMYRTGDRGLRRSDGEIEFHGRLDRQTKIRGQRVELDEIGSALGQHPSVDFATAVMKVSEGGESQLVAYILTKANASIPSANELQKHLLGTLPDYMIPAIFVRLHGLPLSPNGKLDLNILPQPTAANVMERMASKAPTSPIEEELLAIVRELLEDGAVAAEDDFFLAGGHSLLGMQLVLRLRDAFGVDLTLRQLFESPTTERLAILVETVLKEQRLAVIWGELLGRKHVGLDDNFFDLGGNSEMVAVLQQCIDTEFGQRIPIKELFESPTVRKQVDLTLRIMKNDSLLPPGVLSLQRSRTRNSIFWVHYLSANLARAIGDDLSFIFVVLTEGDIKSLGTAPTLQMIAACLVDKILATQPTGNYTIGGLCLGGVLAYEIASQLQAAGRQVSLLVLLDPPDPSFFAARNSLAPKLTQPRYLIKRAMRLGLRITIVKLRERLFKHLPPRVKTLLFQKKMNVAQHMIEAAALLYEPGSYKGKALLFLASDHPPHLNFLPGWQAVVPHGLHTHYVNAHHSELTNVENARGIADIIISHLSSAIDEESLSCGIRSPSDQALIQEARSTSG